MFTLLVMLFVGLAVADAEFTITKINKYGLMVELNPVIRRLVTKFGVDGGVFLGVLPPTLFILFLGYPGNWFLYIMLGMRISLLLFQLKGRQLERAR